MKSLLDTHHLKSIENLGNETTSYESVLKIAATLAPAEPVQCFFPHKLRHQINCFTNNFRGDVAFAVKANPSHQIIKSAHSLGIKTFDVASLPEIDLVASNAPEAKLHYHNPIKSKLEIQTAHFKFGCNRFAIDDLAELRKIFSVTGQNNEIEIAVRFSLPQSNNAVHDFSEKFGAKPAEAAHLLAHVKLLGFSPVLTFHPGSQCTTPAGWIEHIQAAAQIAQNADITLTKLNIGGGFPVKYAKESKYPLEAFFTNIEQAACAAFEVPPQLECEPGRAIVGPSISLLTQVKHVRHEQREIYLNDGIYGSLLEMTQAEQLTPNLKVIKNGKYIQGNQQLYTVYGPTCDPLDRLPNKFQLPMSIAEDDYIEFESLGAYGAATSTRFNGYGHASIVEIKN